MSTPLSVTPEWMCNGFITKEFGETRINNCAYTRFLVFHELHGLSAADKDSVAGCDNFHYVAADFAGVHFPLLCQLFTSHILVLPKVLLKETLFAADISWRILVHAQAPDFLEAASQADLMLCETLPQPHNLRWN